MQQIGILIQDKEGKTIEDSAINFADIIKVVYEDSNHKSKYPLLATIDPYDDTIFNSLQVVQLIQELNGLPPNQAIRDSIEFLKKVEQFQYVEFFGD